MPGLDVEDFYGSDSSDNDESHSRLLSSVSQLDSTQRVKPAQRKEVASEVSEYNLSKGTANNNNLVNVKELAQVLGKKSEHVVIRKKFEDVTKKSKTLPKPLEKPTEERLKRSLGFEKVKNQLRRWDAIVSRNALSDQLTFPLNDNSMKLQKSNEFLSQFKSVTPLEEEIAKVLKEDNKKAEADEEEDDKEFPLTLEEMLEKRKEMAQLRARLSYRQTKAQRQSKIKSKKYHRLMKREKLKQQLKEFEILQKTDPEAALKKLAELDKTRAQERASLRHRNTGQWARNLTVKAKYDVETRKVLAEQLKFSRELTQKTSQLDSSDNEDGEELPVSVPVPSFQPPTAPSSENPWTLDVSKEVQDFVSGYKKFWSEKNKEAAEKKREEVTVRVNGDRGEDGPAEATPKSNEENEKAPECEPPAKGGERCRKAAEAKSQPNGKKSKKGKVEASPKKEKTSVCIQPTSGVWIVTPVAVENESQKNRKRKADDIDNLFDELNEKLMKKAKKKAKKIDRKLKKAKMEEEEKEDSDGEIDLSLKNPKAFERPSLDSGLLEGGEENEVEGRVEPPTGAPAEGGGDKAAAFIDPKNFIQVKPKRLRTRLPDSDAGNEDALDDEKEQQKMMEEAFGDDDVVADFKEMKKQEEESRKVEVESALPGWGSWAGTGIVPKRKKKPLVLKIPPKKNKQPKDVIINENENPNLRDHLVKEVPHPFKSVDAFEAHIRAPIGREWVPETAHQKFIEKPVVTKLGTVIEPMGEDEIVRLKKASKSPYRGKKKTK